VSGRTVSYIVQIHDEGPGEPLWADIEELPGLFASGADLDELREAIAEAIGLYLSGPDEDVKVTVEDEPGAVTERRMLVTC
jgi:predicted RNase H-like HicB family nuclease